MSAYKFPFIGKPYKGEVQIGPFVISKDRPIGKRGPNIGAYFIWFDSAWMWAVEKAAVSKHRQAI